jgi:predicted permease
VSSLLRVNLVANVQQCSRNASSGRRVRALSKGLIVVQVAVALVLLVGAGLLLKSLARAVKVDVGFNPEGVVTARVALPRSHRASDAAARRIREQLLQAMREIPGTTSASLAMAMPLQSGLPTTAFTLEHEPSPSGAPQPTAFRVMVTPGYVETLGLDLVEGRFYEDSDMRSTRAVFVVDQTFARKFFPNRSAIGGRLSFGGRPQNDADWALIIGVVKDIPHNGVDDKSGNPFIYQALVGGRPAVLTLFMRNPRSSPEVVTALSRKIHEIDAAIPLFDAGPLSETIDSSFDNRRALVLILSSFSGLALFLSALGIYGVLAYDVSQRWREIGLRRAVGASDREIVILIMAQGLWKTGTGVVIGLIGAVLLSRYMTSLLFDTQSTDPPVYILVSALLGAVATFASYLPALRACRIDPLEALRD